MSKPKVSRAESPAQAIPPLVSQDLAIALSKARAAGILLRADADYLQLPVPLKPGEEAHIRRVDPGLRLHGPRCGARGGGRRPAEALRRVAVGTDAQGGAVMQRADMVQILDWSGMDGKSLRDVIENGRRAAALVEALGVLFNLDGHGDDYDQDMVVELMLEAGSLGQVLGNRALELLDAQAAPVATVKPRERRAAKRKAA